MKKILVVDDEKDIVVLFKKRLEQYKYEALTATNSDDALAISKTKHPDLILLDIVMPGINGYQICKILKEDHATKDIPVIFLTGKDLEPKGILEHCDELSSCGFLSKLTDIKDIIKKIKEFIE